MVKDVLEGKTSGQIIDISGKTSRNEDDSEAITSDSDHDIPEEESSWYTIDGEQTHG